MTTPSFPSSRRCLAPVALVVALRLAIVEPTAIPATAQPDDPTFAPTDCPFDLPAFLEEGENLACGVVEVPAFHADPGGDRILLAVAVLESTGPDPADEPLVVLTGGPGQPAEPVFAGFDPAYTEIGGLAPLLERQDVVLFDQRGTGYSQPGLYCSTDIPLGESPPPLDAPDGDADESVPTLADEAAACRDALEDVGIDLEAYTTAENAADVEDIRLALGVDQVDLLGVSYGSRLALTVMRDFPRSVRSVILDSPLPPQVDQVAGQLVGFDAALERTFDGCAADPACEDRYGDVEALFPQVIDRLERDPIVAIYDDPATGDEVEVPVDGETFIGLVYLSVFIGPLVPVVAPLIATAVRGSPAVIENVLPILADFGSGFSTGMQLAVNCQDEIAFSSLQDAEDLIEDARVRPEIAGGAGLGELAYYEACEELGLEPEDDRDNEPVVSDLPTLILTGAYDPITPTTYGELALETLENGALVEFGNAGHDPLNSAGPCAVEIAAAFLAAPTAKLDTSCADALTIDFSP